MRLLIAAVGRLKQGPERDLFAHYHARAVAAGRQVALALLDSIEILEARGPSAEQRVRAEAAALLTKLPSGYRAVALDIGGERLSSEAFGSLLGRWRDDGAPGTAFLIGGADGLGEAALAAASLRLSLGPMTLTHGLARIVLAEQVYRAATILAGHPYHRG